MKHNVAPSGRTFGSVTEEKVSTGRIPEVRDLSPSHKSSRAPLDFSGHCGCRGLFVFSVQLFTNKECWIKCDLVPFTLSCCMSPIQTSPILTVLIWLLCVFAFHDQEAGDGLHL